jgi:hypothetical protein
MGDSKNEADRFRGRARKCRELARDARTEIDRNDLLRVAAELEEEADKIDAEEGRMRNPLPPQT